jgi:hypothetical protein
LRIAECGLRIEKGKGWTRARLNPQSEIRNPQSL